MATHCRGRFVVLGAASDSPLVPPDLERVAFVCVKPSPEPATRLSEKGH